MRPDLFTRSVEVEINNTTVGVVLNRLLAPVRAYNVSEQGRLILIRDAEIAGRTWLDYKMRSFRVPREAVDSTSAALHMWLRSQSDPSIKGFAGDSLGGDFDDLTGPFDGHDNTVRELLTLIVSGSKGGMWVAQGPDILRSRSLGSRPFWKILEYSQPMQFNMELIQATAAQARE
ncbi:MAG TPA: hypothetical protein VEU62_14275 [Bryobacterales bacterium]|nr:hypothetical protein [Bryobacterales bacterium]